ncbi:MAG TPA: replication endonuclease [Cellvibrio sp.]|nr:replication endonuclease [Cellvibrio sp.]
MAANIQASLRCGSRSRSKSWEYDQAQFQGVMARRHLDSLSFLTSVRNSVGKQSFYRSRPLITQKDLMGRVVGRVSASIETRRQEAYVEANRALLHVDKVLRVSDLNLSWDDDSLSSWATSRADSCGKIISNDDHSLHVLRWIVNGYGLPWPAHDLYGDVSAVARVCNSKWWRRQARVLKVRAIDQLARHFKMVHAKAQPYASNEAVKLRRAQMRRNRMTLEGFEAVNQDGECYTLAELSDLSVSNPTNRRHELMVRMRGFEQLAEQFGYVGLFITMSAPSKFHPMRQIKNARGQLVRIEENQKYEDATPREAQEWLNKTWSRIRAKLDRDEIKCFGFRVVEPHADGCPHWHQLLFFPPGAIKHVRFIFRKYAVLQDIETGARKYRVKIVEIDRSRGSAAGYIAKYISKSIDGNHIDTDLLGNSGADAAERICAWASSWGVRQFQQIGGPSVTVWRELRRLNDAEGVIEAARVAADASDWAAYFLIQSNGEYFVSRDDAPIKAARWLEHDAITGEVIDEAVNKYGEASKGKLFGLVALGEYVLTRFYRWSIQRVGESAKAVKNALPVCTLSADELLDLLRGDGLNSAA